MKQDRLIDLVNMYRSRAEAARVAGISNAQLGRYLSGKPAGFDAVARLAKHQGVSLDWLAGMPGAKPPAGHRDMSEDEMWELLRASTESIERLKTERNLKLSQVWSTTIQELVVRFGLPDEGVKRILQSIEADEKCAEGSERSDSNEQG